MKKQKFSLSQVTFTKQQLNSIKKLAEYILDSQDEAENYDEFVADGGSKKDHIFYHAQKIGELLG